MSSVTVSHKKTFYFVTGTRFDASTGKPFPVFLLNTLGWGVQMFGAMPVKLVESEDQANKLIPKAKTGAIDVRVQRVDMVIEQVAA